jgi:hypothetical protein
VIAASVAVIAIIVTSVLFYRALGCKDARKRFMNRVLDHERLRLRSTTEVVDRNRAAHIAAFEAEHGPVDQQLTAYFEEALGRDS